VPQPKVKKIAPKPQRWVYITISKFSSCTPHLQNFSRF